MSPSSDKSRQRLLLVSNRLPVTVEKRKGEFAFKKSVGGLATGLASFYTTHDSKWIGWCGLASNLLDAQQRRHLESELIKKFDSHTLFLSRKDIRLFYSGFCNRTIWPLFHYFTDYAHYEAEQWRSYIHVNKLFAQAVSEIANPDDIIWIHDYHLMLLPQLLREKLPDAQIGFFLHIPFPSYEIFRLLPWRKEILQGLMGSDLIGFHTFDYVRHFMSSVRRILGFEQTFGQISHEHRITRVDAFPMGIDFSRFANAESGTEWTESLVHQCKSDESCHTILSVDRLDYTKGIPGRLEAFDYFLDKYPEYKKRVTLILVAVPSRTSVERYQMLKQRVDELVGYINGKHAMIGWIPVLYFYRYMDFNHLTALYKIADVALVTPVRDGMNLIAKEYIATRNGGTGVLVLSEMAGAVSELSEAVIVNPNNQDEVADALEKALNLSEAEQIERNRIMKERIQDYDVVTWAKDFMGRLYQAREIQNALGAKILSARTCTNLKKNYQAAKKRLLFLDYDGTLVPFASSPEKARPDAALKNLLEQLSKDPKNHVVIISGRDRHTLEKWLGRLEVGMSAEHGVWVREIHGEWHMLETIRDDWKEEIRPLMDFFVSRTPGSQIEEKSFSLVWHYRKADPGQGIERAKELKETLLGLTANLHLVVAEGSKVLEVKHGGVNKGRASAFWTSSENWDFLLAVGDDWTDEDLFKAMPEKAYTIKVGMTMSSANYYLKDPADVRELLETLAESSVKSRKT